MIAGALYFVSASVEFSATVRLVSLSPRLPIMHQAMSPHGPPPLFLIIPQVRHSQVQIIPAHSFQLFHLTKKSRVWSEIDTELSQYDNCEEIIA